MTRMQILLTLDSLAARTAFENHKPPETGAGNTPAAQTPPQAPRGPGTGVAGAKRPDMKVGPDGVERPVGLLDLFPPGAGGRYSPKG